MTRSTRGATALLAVIAALTLAGVASAWVAAQKIDTIGGNSSELNTPSQDGCPIQSPDGLSLYLASNRPGGKGGLDVWVATRASPSAPWGAPQNLGEPVNSAADDFCPTPVGKNGLFFVSREALPGACGQGDIYFTHRNAAGTFGPSPSGSSAPRPAPTRSSTSRAVLGGRQRQAARPKHLYFSRSSVTPSVPGEIFMSEGRTEPASGLRPQSPS